jgi:hypothetical protein
MHQSLENMLRLDKEVLLVGGLTPGRWQVCWIEVSNLVLRSEVYGNVLLIPVSRDNDPVAPMPQWNTQAAFVHEAPKHVRMVAFKARPL